MRVERRWGTGWMGVWLVLSVHLTGCGDPPTAQFADSELLLGLDGSYKLDMQHVGSVSAYEVRVQGEAVIAHLDRDDDYGSSVVLIVETLSAGMSVVDLLHDGRVVDTLSIEVAVVEQLHPEIMLDFEEVLLTEPFGLLVNDVVLLRLGGSDSRGRVFDRFWRELADVDDSILVAQVWRNFYSLDARVAGESRITAVVGGGATLETSVRVLAPTEIVAMHIEPRGDAWVVVIGTNAEGLRVQLLDATVTVGGEAASSHYAFGFYSVGEDNPRGTVISASWSNLTATLTL